VTSRSKWPARATSPSKCNSRSPQSRRSCPRAPSSPSDRTPPGRRLLRGQQPFPAPPDSQARLKASRVNRYPLWRYVVIVVALLFGLIYTLPNFFGEAPAVQVSSLKATIKVDEQTERQVLAALESADIRHDGVLRDPNSVK